jgi:hypothetical protein
MRAGWRQSAGAWQRQQQQQWRLLQQFKGILGVVGGRESGSTAGCQGSGRCSGCLWCCCCCLLWHWELGHALKLLRGSRVSDRMRLCAIIALAVQCLCGPPLRTGGVQQAVVL